jgi:hypothetical protein
MSGNTTPLTNGFLYRAEVYAANATRRAYTKPLQHSPTTISHRRESRGPCPSNHDTAEIPRGLVFFNLTIKTNSSSSIAYRLLLPKPKVASTMRTSCLAENQDGRTSWSSTMSVLSWFSLAWFAQYHPALLTCIRNSARFKARRTVSGTLDRLRRYQETFGDVWERRHVAQKQRGPQRHSGSLVGMLLWRVHAGR